MGVASGFALVIADIEEDIRNDLVNVTIPFEADIAQVPRDPVRREASGLVLSGLLNGGYLRDALKDVIVGAGREARDNGLTDADIDAELRVWRAETRR